MLKKTTITREALEQTQADKAKLEEMLLTVERTYQIELEKVSTIPVLSRLADLLAKIFSFGMYDTQGRRKEIQSQKKTIIHRRFGKEIDRIKMQIARLSNDLEYYRELDRLTTIEGSIGTRADGYPANWEEIAKQVRERDQHRCTQCGATDRSLHVHHMIALSAGGSNAETNLLTLCDDCHASKHPHMRR